VEYLDVGEQRIVRASSLQLADHDTQPIRLGADLFQFFRGRLVGFRSGTKTCDRENLARPALFGRRNLHCLCECADARQEGERSYQTFHHNFVLAHDTIQIPKCRYAGSQARRFKNSI
jgi:hypothetical protein